MPSGAVKLPHGTLLPIPRRVARQPRRDARGGRGCVWSPQHRPPPKGAQGRQRSTACLWPREHGQPPKGSTAMIRHSGPPRAPGPSPVPGPLPIPPTHRALIPCSRPLGPESGPITGEPACSREFVPMFPPVASGFRARRARHGSCAASGDRLLGSCAAHGRRDRPAARAVRTVRPGRSVFPGVRSGTPDRTRGNLASGVGPEPWIDRAGPNRQWTWAAHRTGAARPARRLWRAQGSMA